MIHKTISVLLALFLSSFLLTSQAFATDDDFDDDFDEPAWTTDDGMDMPETTFDRDEFRAGFEIDLEARSGSGGLTYGFDDDGNPVGISDGASLSRSGVKSNVGTGCDGDGCPGVGGRIEADIEAANQMLIYADDVTGGLEIGSYSESFGDAKAGLDAFRERIENRDNGSSDDGGDH